MKRMISDRRDIDFVLHEQMELPRLLEGGGFPEYDAKTIDLIINEAANLALKELLPAQIDGDREGCGFEKGEVKVPSSYRRAYQLIKEGEWVALSEDTAWGGQGTPAMAAMAAYEYMVGANSSFMMYPGLTRNVGRLIEEYGSEREKETVVRKLYAGEWGGAMAVTESSAGSDIGSARTTAVKNQDGSYSISGAKIFISSGEHDLTENIIYAVLGRIEGAPGGMGGLSMFLVPKYRIGEDGGSEEFNHVVCTGIEEKMGLHGNPTCSLSFGEKGVCRGSLLGPAGKGAELVFYLINESRRKVGLQGLGYASAAYMHALNYARERHQGKHLLNILEPDAPSVPIIEHPDVKRQLMMMKAYVAGMRSLLYYSAFLSDSIKTTDDPGEQARHRDMIDFLTPLIKAYVSDRAFDVCSQAIQVYGGSGYIREYPVEQLLRDSRVAMIYEGTNGIQAIEFLSQKLRLKMGGTLKNFLSEMKNTVDRAEKTSSVSALAGEFKESLGELEKVIEFLNDISISPRIMTAYSFASLFLEVFGDVVFGWLHLWRAQVAAEQLEKGDCGSSDTLFYQGQLKTAEYFIRVILPVTGGKMKSILNADFSVVEMNEESF